MGIGFPSSSVTEESQDQVKVENGDIGHKDEGEGHKNNGHTIQYCFFFFSSCSSQTEVVAEFCCGRSAGGCLPSSAAGGLGSS